MCALCSCALFFLRYGDHRYLHSFPTRRSSDLVAGQIRDEWRDALAAPAWVAHLIREALEQTDGKKEGKRRRDRKSTRLNSSHRCISYAVFCLKKKKKINITSSFITYHKIILSK